jgi:hypothetical protein
MKVIFVGGTSIIDAASKDELMAVSSRADKTAGKM